MSFTVKSGQLDEPEVQRVVQIHLDDMTANSPKCHVFALDDLGLGHPDVTLLSAWEQDVCLGIGALKDLGGKEGEIKSMRTDPGAVNRGVATFLLDQIVGLAKTRSYTRISLETGSGANFEAAIALYKRYGFESCGPFADYVENGFNQFFCLDLSRAKS